VLSLFDQMIVQPYQDRLSQGNLSSPNSTVVLTAQNLDAQVMDSFYELVKTTNNNKRESLASSHDVIKANDAAWGTISTYLLWG